MPVFGHPDRSDASADPDPEQPPAAPVADGLGFWTRFLVMLLSVTLGLTGAALAAMMAVLWAVGCTMTPCESDAGNDAVALLWLLTAGVLLAAAVAGAVLPWRRPRR